MVVVFHIEDAELDASEQRGVKVYTAARGEREVFRKHWLPVAPRLIWEGVVSALIFAAGIVWGPSFRVTLFSLGTFPLLWAIYQAFAHYMRTFAVTQNGEIVCGHGLFHEEPNRISLRQAQQLSVHQSWLGKQLDFGDIQFIAGDTFVLFLGVAQFTRFRQLIEAHGKLLVKESIRPQPVNRDLARQRRRQATGTRWFGSTSQGQKLRLVDTEIKSRYRRFLSFCNRLMKQSDRKLAGQAHGWPRLLEEEQRFLLVLIRSGLLSRGSLYWAPRIRTLTDVQRRIGPKELEKALSIIRHD